MSAQSQRVDRAGTPAGPRTVSGKVLAVSFGLGALALVGFLLVFAPLLQDSASRQLGGALDRDVLDRGTLAGTEWLVAAEYTNGRSCVVAELDGEPASQACAGADADLLGDVAVAAVPAGGYVFTGVVDLELPQVAVQLDTGEQLVPRVFRVRGYPASFYYTLVDPGVAVEQVVARDRAERELAVQRCDGPLASVDGIGEGCEVTPASP